jgi:hypothetical protein
MCGMHTAAVLLLLLLLLLLVRCHACLIGICCWWRWWPYFLTAVHDCWDLTRNELALKILQRLLAAHSPGS